MGTTMNTQGVTSERLTTSVSQLHTLLQNAAGRNAAQRPTWRVEAVVVAERRRASTRSFLGLTAWSSWRQPRPTPRMRRRRSGQSGRRRQARSLI